MRKRARTSLPTWRDRDSLLDVSLCTYIQASEDASSEPTLEGELAPPLSVRDAPPKVLIARTRHEPYTREGVLVPDLARWLLGEQGL